MIESTEGTEIVTSETVIVTSEIEIRQGLGTEQLETTETATRMSGIDTQVETIGEIQPDREIPWKKTRKPEAGIPIKDRGLCLEKSTIRRWTTGEPNSEVETPMIAGTLTKGSGLLYEKERT